MTVKNKGFKRFVAFSRTQKSNWLCINTMGSRGKGFSPCFRESSPRPPCIAPTFCPSSPSGICSLCVSHTPSKKAKSLITKKGQKSPAIDDGFCVCHYRPKGQRVTPLPETAKGYITLCKASRSRLLLTSFVCATTARKGKGFHYRSKGQKVTLYCARLQGYGFCRLHACATTTRKGQRVTAFCAYPLPHCAVRCCRACMEVLIEIPFYQYFHTCPYL